METSRKKSQIHHKTVETDILFLNSSNFPKKPFDIVPFLKLLTMINPYNIYLKWQRKKARKK